MTYDQRHDTFRAQNIRPRPPMKAGPGLRPAKPRIARWSHQRELEGFKNQHVRVLLDAGWIAGILVEADQFTIKLARPDDKSSTIIYFKSAILAFQKVD